MLKTFVQAHYLEHERSLDSRPQNTFDTTFDLVYAGGVDFGDDMSTQNVEVALYLFDDTGDLIQTAGQVDVCNSCQFTLDADNPQQQVRLDDLITRDGGTFPTSFVSGIAMLDVQGDVDNFAASAFLLNSHSGPFDVEGVSLQLQPLDNVLPGQDARYVIPDIIESDDGAFNDILFATYVTGLPGAPDVPSGDSGADVDIFLYDQNTGQPMRSASGVPIANPATFHLDSAGRKISVLVENLFQQNGGFAEPLTEGYAVVRVRGDVTNVKLEHIQFHGRESGNLDMASVRPQFVTSTTVNSFIFPHLLETSGGILDATNVFDTQIFVTYVADQAGAPSSAGNETSVDIFLFDEVTGDLLQADAEGGGHATHLRAMHLPDG